jgi:predicted PhzF superfamily epimerase YddE/YHI9
MAQVKSYRYAVVVLGLEPQDLLPMKPQLFSAGNPTVVVAAKDKVAVDRTWVANGASELFIEVFEERGAHTRSALGVSQIPFGSCVEIEMVVETFVSESERGL